MMRGAVIGSLLWMFLAIAPPPSAAQVLLGARGGVYTADGDPFIGGEVLAGIERNLYLNPNLEYIFADHAAKATFNFDLHYDFAQRGRAFFWIGAGLAILYVDPESSDSSTDAGANVLFGVGFRGGGRVIPYIQAKILASDDSDFALAFGLRF
jgi:hypothetical protein